MSVFNFFLMLCLCSVCVVHAEILEIRLTVTNEDCIYCARSIAEELLRLPEVQDAKIYPFAGFGQVIWKKNAPFQSRLIFRTFAQTHFLLREINLQVQGVVTQTRGSTIIKSYPDNSVFYVSNRGDFGISTLKAGQTVRFKGIVSNIQGCNMVTVTELLPPIL